MPLVPPTNGRASYGRKSLLALIAVGALAASMSGCGSARRSMIRAVFPIPGSQVASPQTQIVFRGLPIARLHQVVVTGSRSGPHTGRLEADSDGDGGSFIPAKPFTPGEVVTVRTRPYLAAGEKSFSFRIATPASPIPTGGVANAPRLPGDVLSFHSRPDLTPATVEITTPASRPTGDIFLSPQAGPVQNGPMIVSPSGDLVWFKPLPSGQTATDFRIQRYRGRSVLTWWQGYIGAGVGIGEGMIYDSAYRQVATVKAANGLHADLHEFELTPQGNALITAYYPVYWNASSARGSQRVVVLDSVVQEIDIKTGLLLFQWDSLDHVPLSDSYQPAPKSPADPYDYFHVNSVQPDSDGNLVVSGRNTWAAYKLDLNSGRVIWTLGGKRSTFALPSAARFAFQHDVRVRASGDRLLTLFDDGAGPPTVHQQSRGLTLALDPRLRVANLTRSDIHTPPLLAEYEGNVQDLPNGDQFVGWGQQPYFTEFDRGGRIVLDGRFVDANLSYRIYSFPWRGTPTTRPAIAATTSAGATAVYASWNGATGVVSWQVLTGQSASRLKPAGTFPYQGFETEMTVPSAPYVAVRAIGTRRRVLSTSPPVRPR